MRNAARHTTHHNGSGACDQRVRTSALPKWLAKTRNTEFEQQLAYQLQKHLHNNFEDELDKALPFLPPEASH